MKNEKRLFRRLGTIAVTITIAATLGGCAKEREYKTIYKDGQVQPAGLKDQLTHKEFLYSVSQLESPHSTQGTFPGWMGDPRIVKFRFDENSLMAETVIEDGRFSDNTANAKPVLSIPVKHIQYRCADNGAGECANKEEENNDIPWSKKNRFQTDINGMKVAEISALPLELDGAFPGSCQTEIGSRVVDAHFTTDSVNIEIEKTYRSKIECVDFSAIESIGDLTFSVRQMYSFVAREAIVSKNYEMIEYPQNGKKTDENTFGFFTTDLNRLSSDNRPEETGQRVLVNRWNPNRKVIHYSLTPNYNKPENAAIKAATMESVAAVNNALAEAQVDLKIEISPEANNNYGDVRNSMLVLVEDPQATGVIGYGPTTADPRTGEILSGRVVMYAGTMKKYLRISWDEIVDEAREAAAQQTEEAIKAAKAEAARTAANDGEIPVQLSTPGSQKGIEFAAPTESKIQSYMSKHMPAFNIDHVLKNSAAKNISVPSNTLVTGEKLSLTANGIKQALKQATNVRDNTFKGAPLVDEEDFQSKRELRLNALSKFNIYPAELVNFKGALELSNLEGLKDVRKVYWLELTEAERQKVMAVALPYIWVPTLVHELGHNMGLRHNFAGSEDKANYYTKEEIAKYGQTHDMIYSSVMDYGYRSVNELRMMGKYDVAALRYGYRREVQIADGSFLKLPTGKTKLASGVEVASSIEALPAVAQSGMKEFKYCTDEHVGLNPGCRRQDEGTTYTEIATHLANAYNRNYRNTNHRNGRVNFSDTDDGVYANRIAGTFFDMRQFFEVYDRLLGLGIPADHEIWKTNPGLKDIKDAMLVARSAMISPMLTPPATCAMKTESGQIVFGTMDQLGGHYSTCFADQLKEAAAEYKLTMYADLGREFQNQKYDDSTNSYADQIDVRGMWADKLIAPMTMLRRRTGITTFDRYTGNYVDRVSGTLETVMAITQGFLLNELNLKNVPMKLENGSIERRDLFTFSPDDSHWMPVFRSKSLRRALGVADAEVPYSQMLLRMVLSEMKENVPNTQARALKNYFGLYTKIKEGDSYANYITLDVDGARYFAHKTENTFAVGVADMLNVTTVMEKVDVKRLKVVLAAAVKGEASERDQAREALVLADRGETQKADEETLSPAEQAAAKLGSDAVKAYIDGTFQSSDYYVRVIKMVGEVNQAVVY